MYRDGKSVFAGKGWLKFYTKRMRRFAKKGRKKYIRRLASEQIKEQT